MSISAKLQLHCPVCHRALPFPPGREQEVRCSCGVSYCVVEEVLDFYAQEQTIVNAWSQTTPTPSTTKQIRSWLNSGLITTADLEYINTDVNSERLKVAYQQGIRMLHQAMLSEPGVVLDLCTGMGSLFRDIEFAAHPAAQLTIMTDLSRTVLAAVRSRLAGAVPTDRYAYIACDVRRLPLADKSVNLVVTIAGYQNADSATELLEETLRVLIPGSRLNALCSFVDEDSRSMRLSDQLGFGDLITRNRMNTTLTQVGFKEIAVNVLFHDVAHGRGDLVPLRGEALEIALVTAKR